jgi:hypothetical protein
MLYTKLVTRLTAPKKHSVVNRPYVNKHLNRTRGETSAHVFIMSINWLLLTTNVILDPSEHLKANIKLFFLENSSLAWVLYFQSPFDLAHQLNMNTVLHSYLTQKKGDYTVSSAASV